MRLRCSGANDPRSDLCRTEVLHVAYLGQGRMRDLIVNNPTGQC